MALSSALSAQIVMGAIGSLVNIQMAETNKCCQILQTEVRAGAGAGRAVDPPLALSAPVRGHQWKGPRTVPRTPCEQGGHPLRLGALMEKLAVEVRK